jgi:hypothetical protein
VRWPNCGRTAGPVRHDTGRRALIDATRLAWQEHVVDSNKARNAVVGQFERDQRNLSARPLTMKA